MADASQQTAAPERFMREMQNDWTERTGQRYFEVFARVEGSDKLCGSVQEDGSRKRGNPATSTFKAIAPNGVEWIAWRRFSSAEDAARCCFDEWLRRTDPAAYFARRGA